MGGPATLERAPQRRRIPAGVLAVVAVGVGLTVVATAVAHNVAADRRQRRFDAVALSARTALSRQVDLYAQVLTGLRASYGVNGGMTRDGFAGYVAGSEILRNVPGAVAVSFVRQVPAAQKEAYEASVRKEAVAGDDGYAAFTVHPEPKLPTMMVVEFTSTRAGLRPNQLGFDVSSDRGRRRAVEEARDSGLVTATPPVKLVLTGRRGFLLYLGVFDQPVVPATAPSRRRHFVGVFTAVFDAQVMLREAVGANPAFAANIYDVGRVVDSGPDRAGTPLVLYGRPSPQGSGGGQSDRLRATLDLAVGSRRWRAVVSARAPFDAGPERIFPWLTFAILGLVTAGLTALTFSTGRARDRARQMADRITDDLFERERQLADSNRLLGEANDDLRSTAESRRQFLQVISHELQTPLISIAVLSQLVADRSGPDDETSDYARRIVRNARSLSLVVDELVDFTRLERTTAALYPRVVHLAEALAEVVDQLEVVLGGRPITVTEEGTCSAWADPDALTRVVGNLLTNAVKFSPEGSPVALAMACVGDHCEISVTDAGPGVAEAERTAVFEPFFRGSAASGRPGTGVGLAVVRELTQSMGGTVRVDDAPGGGARFTVVLPARAPGRSEPVVDEPGGEELRDRQ